MSDSLGSALNSAFDEAIGKGTSASEVDHTPEREPVETSAPEAPAEAAPEPAAKALPPTGAPTQPEEPTGDVLMDKLTAEEIAAIKADPALRKVYAGLMKSYTPKMQALAEQQKLWDALNDPATKRQAVEALARAAGVEITPSDAPQREQADRVADDITTQWAQVVGPEAAAALRPLIEKTALAAVQGTIEPLKMASEAYQQDARIRQADAQTTQFRTLAKEKGWNLTPEVEAKMAELGQQFRPAKPIESVKDGVAYLEKLYAVSSFGTADSDAEKRVLAKQQKAFDSQEPARGVPSTGREKRSNITKDMDLSQSMDQAFKDLGYVVE